MIAYEGHSRTDTWSWGEAGAGATPPSRVVAAACAALVTPAHVPSEDRSSTVPVRTEYRD